MKRLFAACAIALLSASAQAQSPGDTPNELAPGAARIMTYITECDAMNYYGPRRADAVETVFASHPGAAGYIGAILQSANQDVAWAANRKAYSDFNEWLNKYSGDKKLLCRDLGELYKSVAEKIGGIHPNAVANQEIRRIAEFPSIPRGW